MFLYTVFHEVLVFTIVNFRGSEKVRRNVLSQSSES